MLDPASNLWNQPLAEAFGTVYGGLPTLLARAPGRVNLLGEHTDYNALPVLPMALQREARLALRPRDDGIVRIQNLDREFDSIEFEVHPRIPASAPGHWENYCKAPADELACRFAIWRGFDAVFASSVPVAAGLSSSSALVNALGIALAHVNEVGLDALELADLMAEAERYTGTRGGGMDQAISMCAKRGCAARIDFQPLRLAHVAVPEDWCFIVADTGVRAEKSGAAQGAYNRRREECEEALEIVTGVVREAGVTRGRLDRYPQLLSAIGEDAALSAGSDALTGNLGRRFRHVITEASRVTKAADLLLSADLDGFGDLMDASHESLRTDFHVSSPELDELVAIAREGGAVGARLTGAGFGGCTVSLSDRGSVDGVLKALVADYYEPRGLSDGLDDRLFVAIPSQGASITTI